jgi:hypothetical protein
MGSLVHCILSLKRLNCKQGLIFLRTSIGLAGTESPMALISQWINQPPLAGWLFEIRELASFG